MGAVGAGSAVPACAIPPTCRFRSQRGPGGHGRSRPLHNGLRLCLLMAALRHPMPGDFASSITEGSRSVAHHRWWQLTTFGTISPCRCWERWPGYCCVWNMGVLSPAKNDSKP
jgi:hypothetical protein